MASTSETLNLAISGEDDDDNLDGLFQRNTRNQVIPSSMESF